jgi:glycosyltransferase involved in cell wall biosynthesis
MRRLDKKVVWPMPKVSVVIPTYNQASFIDETIRSVLNQTFQDFEIIVIDDGSTDNTPEVISALPVRYFRQENQGCSAARNHGIKLSSGEYIAFLDSDDVLMENALEKGVDVLDRHPEVGFSYGQAYMMDENGRIHRVRKSSFLDSSTIVDGTEQIRELLFFNRIPMSTLMVRRHCLDDVGGFNEELKNFEDRHICIRLAKRYSAAYIAEPLVKYRVHPNQIHKSVNHRLAEKAHLLILREIFEDPDTAPHFHYLKSRAYSYCYYRIARYAYGKDMRLARHYLRKAIWVYPQIMLCRDGLFSAYKYATSLLPGSLRLALRKLKWHLLDSRRLRE